MNTPRMFRVAALLATAAGALAGGCVVYPDGYYYDGGYSYDVYYGGSWAYPYLWYPYGLGYWVGPSGHNHHRPGGYSGNYHGRPPGGGNYGGGHGGGSYGGGHGGGGGRR